MRNSNVMLPKSAPFTGFISHLRSLALTTLFISILSAPANSQPEVATGIVEGRVSSQLSGHYLANARIMVDGGSQAVTTDANGNYRLTGVTAGSQRITAHYVGLASVTGDVEVVPGRSTLLDFSMGRTSGQTSTREGEIVVMEEFQVIADREESAIMRALNEQRQSPNIKNVVAFDEFPTPGDDNIGDYMRFIPGLSVVYSGRAAIDASIRGMPSDTSSITIDGLALAGAGFSGSRTVSLVAVPTANISTIEVTKVPTPDMPAHGLGGSINVTTKSGFERTKPLFTYDLHTAFDPGLSISKRTIPDASIKGKAVRPSFSLGYVHPVNNSLSFSLNASQKNTYSEPVTAVPGWSIVEELMSSAALAFGYQSVTVNTGRVGLDWKLGSKHVFGASYSYREREANQGTPTFSVTFGGGRTGDPNSTQGAPTGVGTLGQAGTWENLITDTRHADFKYRYMGDTWQTNLTASHSISSTSFVPQERLGYFGGSQSITIPNLVLSGSGFDGTAKRPSDVFGSLTAHDRSGSPVNFGDSSMYTINTVSARDWRNEVEKGQLRIDMRRDYLNAVPFTIRIGLAYSTENQEVADGSKTYTFRPGTSIEERRVSNYDVVDPSFVTPNVFGQSMQWVSKRKLYDLYQANPTWFVANEVLAHRTRVNASKELEEKITAAYLRVDTRLFQDRLWLAGGVRYERTANYGEGPLVDPMAQYVRNPDGSLATTSTGALIFITPDALEREKLIYTERGVTQKTSFDDFFPSLNATYNLTQDLLLRAGYARTIGRPNLAFIIPGISYSNRTATSTSQTITVVNSRLQPWTADNFDISLESYLFKGGFGSIGVFQKDIAGFFLATSQPGTPELLTQYGIFPVEGDDLAYTIVTRSNGGDARVRGLELSYRQNLTFLPEWAQGVQVFVNYTRSQLAGSTTADFTGFNPETLSWGANLTRSRFVVKFSATEQGETKRNAVAPIANFRPVGLHQYQGRIKRYVLSAEYRINKNLSIYANWSDLNDRDGYVITQRIYNDDTPQELRTSNAAAWGQALAVGIKGSF
jgi:iron complex outermembrane recepter protein